MAEANNIQYITIGAVDNAIRLDRWFQRHMPDVPHTILEKALRKGYIRLDKKRVRASQKVMTGQVITIPPLKRYTESREKNVRPVDAAMRASYAQQIAAMLLYEDEHIIVLNKPAGIAVQGGKGITHSIDKMVSAVFTHKGDQPKLVHRLDKATSGVLVIARNAMIANQLAQAFKTHSINKEYVAIVVNVPKKQEGHIDLPLLKMGTRFQQEKTLVSSMGKVAHTVYQVKGRAFFKEKHMALLALFPKTGRNHQLRVHMAAMGTPILGDGKYGRKIAYIDDLSSRLHLHAYHLTIYNVLAQNYQFKAPLPDYFKETCRVLDLSYNYYC